MSVKNVELYLQNEDGTTYKIEGALSGYSRDESKMTVSIDYARPFKISPIRMESLEIKDVIFNDPATIVFWDDGTKTVVKSKGEPFDKEKGLAMAYVKKIHDGKSPCKTVLKKWCYK